MPTTARVVITGLGIVCPIGTEPTTILDALRAGRSGIGPLTFYSTEHLQSKLAGEVSEVRSNDKANGCDRTLPMAVTAARQAWTSAGMQSAFYPSRRIGLCVGASGAGLNHGSPKDVFGLRYQPQAQATAIASALGITGPLVMFSSASAGSALALAHAANFLRGGYCDAVIAGGAECLSQVNHESMDSMRLCSVGPCSPFSGEPGLTVGEGSAFFVLECFEDAVSRQASIRAELFGFGVTQDAYDVVAGDPSGAGLASALLGALRSAGASANEIGWIKANGTSNRDQDAAETLALKEVFETPPPVCALESFVGHANGAAPAIGLGLALLAFESGLLPPTLHFVKARAGCDLDYVPNQARESTAAKVLANSVGFGGSNVALIFGKPSAARLSATPEPGLCITGVGVVSAFGEGFDCFIQGLRAGASAIKPALRWQSPAAEASFAGLAEEPQNRQFSNKLTLLQRFALTAAAEALQSAAVPAERFNSSRVGLFVGLCRGSAAARSQYAAALSDTQARRSMGKAVVKMGRFTVASALSQHFQLKGYGATIAEGFGAGLHALAHACVHLESSAAEHALLVIAADESGPGPAHSLADLNWLAAGHDGCFLQPYDPQSKGTVLGEGAVALMVERTSHAESRGARVLARIHGVGLGMDAISKAIDKLPGKAAAISAVYGNGSGIWAHDEAEMCALRQSLPPVPFGCVNGPLGFAESASGLFQAAAALHGLHEGEFFPVRERSNSPSMIRGSFPCQLLTARTEERRTAAVVLGA